MESDVRGFDTQFALPPGSLLLRSPNNRKHDRKPAEKTNAAFKDRYMELLRVHGERTNENTLNNPVDVLPVHTPPPSVPEYISKYKVHIVPSGMRRPTRTQTKKVHRITHGANNQYFDTKHLAQREYYQVKPTYIDEYQVEQSRADSQDQLPPSYYKSSKPIVDDNYEDFEESDNKDGDEKTVEENELEGALAEIPIDVETSAEASSQQEEDINSSDQEEDTNFDEKEELNLNQEEEINSEQCEGSSSDLEQHPSPASENFSAKYLLIISQLSEELKRAESRIHELENQTADEKREFERELDDVDQGNIDLQDEAHMLQRRVLNMTKERQDHLMKIQQLELENEKVSNNFEKVQEIARMLQVKTTLLDKKFKSQQVQLLENEAEKAISRGGEKYSLDTAMERIAELEDMNASLFSSNKQLINKLL